MTREGQLEDRLLSICIRNLERAVDSTVFERVDERLEAFQSDPTWPIFGFDNHSFLLMQARGNFYTAIFRKVGDLFQECVAEIVEDRLGLSRADQEYSFDLEINGSMQNRSLDVGIDLDSITSESARRRARKALTQAGAPASVSVAVCEIRGCYMIGDSKRIQADEQAATAARAAGLLPVMLVFCTTSLSSPIIRLRRSWSLYEGMETYDFLKNLTGFDLLGFLTEKEKEIRVVTDLILDRFSE